MSMHSRHAQSSSSSLCCVPCALPVCVCGSTLGTQDHCEVGSDSHTQTNGGEKCTVHTHRLTHTHITHERVVKGAGVCSCPELCVPCHFSFPCQHAAAVAAVRV